ncbi:MAG: hypothetical protein M5U34_48655 [Chloroflexi bacterium]|nr:hypothetical protein [Chloroflexota bacterium]
MADYGRLWTDPSFKPDELKLYPTMLLENAELYEYWQRGEYKPYKEEEVIDVLIRCKVQTPPYARLTRIIRDIPTTNVVEGFKKPTCTPDGSAAHEKARFTVPMHPLPRG